MPKLRKHDLKPIPAAESPTATHSPYGDGDCSLCHKNKDPNEPGPLNAPVNQLCLECHEDFQKVLSLKASHVAAKESCVSCHNPHNSKLSKLLVEDTEALCFGCHENIKTLVTQAKVKHEALTMQSKCANCHDPHGANVEHLLKRLPYDLCAGCHSQEGVTDPQGRRLVNFAKLLQENPKHHGPVVDKDCSACHNPHGGDNFRLLIADYPAPFYSPYDPKLYALCFECHESNIAQDPETTTLTRFRNGKVNLHFLHVNKAERGRTCRACHEVHAAKQEHQIRDGVPYGSKGWILKVNFTQTPTGGTCAKTCHEARSYTNSAASLSAVAPANP